MIAEFRRQRAQAVDVNSDPGALHLCEDSLERELHIGEETPGATCLYLGVQHRGQFADRRGLGSEIVVAAVQRELTVLTWGDGPPQVALTEAREVSRALPGLHQIRRQRRVGGDALQVHAIAFADLPEALEIACIAAEEQAQVLIEHHP